MIDQATKLRMMTRPNASTVSLDKTKLPHIIAITSGKGGVGKSNIAANLGVMLAARGIRTAILDADLGLSNIEVLLDCPAKRNLADVIHGGMSIGDVWVDGPAGVKVISAGSGVEWLANLTQQERRATIASLVASKLGVDTLIIDTAPGISGSVLDFLQVATEVFVVTTPEPTALMDTYALIKTMSQHEMDCRIELTVNCAYDQQFAQMAALNLNATCNKFLPRSIDAWNWLPFDHNLPDAVRYQRPISQLYPASAMVKRLRLITLEVVSRIVAHRMVAPR